MKRILAMILALSMILALCACGQTAAPAPAASAAPAEAPAADPAPAEEAAVEVNWPDFITIGGGGSTATFYAVASALGQLISDNTDCIATGQATNGGTNNMQLLQSGEIELGMSDQFTANVAYTGTGDFEGKALTNLRAVAVIYRGYFAIQATPDSGITTAADLAGKTVAVGMANSGTETVTKTVFGAMGYDYTNASDIKAEFVGASSGTDLLRNGQADAMTFLAPIPDSSQTEIMLTAKTHLVSVSDEALEQFASSDSPLAPDVIPAGTYDGQTEEIKTVYAPMVLWTTEEMDEEVIYEITKMLYENLDTLANSNAVFGKITDENIVAGVSIPFHSGAERFYKEVGIIK